MSNKKAGTKREGKVQLINANGLYEKRRKALGNKRNDIPESAITEITQVYGDFRETEISKIFNNEDFGYTKITVERPLRGEDGELLLKNGKKQPGASLRDTENVSLTENIQDYFKREVLPFSPDAWIDEKKSKVGYHLRGIFINMKHRSLLLKLWQRYWNWKRSWKAVCRRFLIYEGNEG